MAPTRILFVCTGNQCRSPVAATLMGRRLAQLGADVVVDSAGLIRGGAPSPPELVTACRQVGVDLSAHRSRRIDAADVSTADLVVGMAREHVREAVILDPDAFPRTFSLREVVRRAGLAGGRTDGAGLREWLAVLHDGRKASDLLGASLEDDVADPVGGPAAGYRMMVDEVDGLVGRLMAAGWSTV